MRRSPSPRGRDPLVVGLLCLPLLGSAPAVRPAPRPVADWGEPDWTIAALATPAGERVTDALAAARISLGPSGTPVRLLMPARFVMSADLGSGVLATYASLAGIRRAGPVVAAQTYGLARRQAISAAALRSGVSPRYLLAVARAESGLSTYARTPASSAAGLFQFVDQTWLRTLRRYGAGLGLGPEAGAIRAGADGRFWVVDPRLRDQIYGLRYDPEVSARIAGALTRENAAALRSGLGRWPTAGELYAAHLLGPRQALLLLSAVQAAPAYPARAILPAAAASNPGLFFSGTRPRSVGQVFALIADRVSGAREP